MSRYDYEESRRLVAHDPPFYALIMAAMRKADTGNLELLKMAFPDTWIELKKRYHAPGGVLASDPTETIQLLDLTDEAMVGDGNE